MSKEEKINFRWDINYEEESNQMGFKSVEEYTQFLKENEENEKNEER